MSDKLRGQSANKPESELTKLKALWRHLSEDAKEFWRSRFVSGDSQSILRGEIKTKLKINLRHDNQLTYFRQWVDAQDERELLAAKIEERQAELLAGGRTLEQAQEVLLAESAAYSVAARDFKLGVKVSAQISNTVSGRFQAQLEKDKMELKKKDQELAREKFEVTKKKITEALNEVGKGKAGKLDAATKKEILEAIDKKLLGEA